MIELQKSVVSKYKNLFENPTLRQMSLDSGIQVTRLHRILRGSIMKLDEYEILLNRVDENTGSDFSLLASQFERTVPKELVDKMKDSILRKTHHWELLNKALEVC